MKKYVVFVLAALLLFAVVGCEKKSEEQSETAQPEEKGDWRMTKETVLSGDKVRNTNEYEYDEYGNLIKLTNRGNNGKVQTWEENEYDEHNRLVRNMVYLYTGSLSHGYHFIYDDKGLKISSEAIGSDGEVKSRTQYEYDANGNCIKVASFDVNGKPGPYSEYEYDANGNPIRRSRYRCVVADDTVIDFFLDNRIQYEYDANGHMIKSQVINAYDIITGEATYEYDENGDMIKTGSENRYTLHEYEYDENGNLIVYSCKFSDNYGRDTERTEYEWAYFENAPKIEKYKPEI